MKNNIFSYRIARKAFIALFISSLVGCRPDLLDTTPYDQVATGNMWTTANLTEQGMNAIYNVLKYGEIGNNFFQYDEYGSIAQNRNLSDLCGKALTPSASLYKNLWQDCYEGISRTNDAIANIPAKSPISEELKARYIAEAKFFRAYLYYRLNELFHGVPVYLEPTEAEAYNKGQESEEKVWEIILQDLSDCINTPELPDRYESTNANHGRVTKSCAYTLRGKVYLYLRQYEKAIADFEAVGNCGHTLFAGSYQDLFTETNERCPEMIFTVECSQEAKQGNNMQMWFGSRSCSLGGGYLSCSATPEFVDSYENADGSKFNWDDVIPGYNSMDPKARIVYFFRDQMTQSDKNTWIKEGADMDKYLSDGNEARIMQAFENRDPRMQMTLITPYKTFFGAVQTEEHTFTFRIPFITGNDKKAPWDLFYPTMSNKQYYYPFRKFVMTGNSLLDRGYAPINTILFRYADVLLMQAEAWNEQADSQENRAKAIDLVNKVRERAGVVPLTLEDVSKPTYVSGQADLRERIRNERRWELAGEGHSFFDELRWKIWKEKKFDTGGAKTVSGKIVNPYMYPGDYYYTWPAPTVECQRNSNLNETPGWIY